MESGNVVRRTWLPAWLPAAALLLVSWVAVAAFSLQVRPDAEVVAVAFPPWWNTQRALLAAASANAAFVRMTAVPSVLVLRPDGHDGLKKLREAGAWLALDPQAIDACFKNKSLGIGE
ncbi:MULTISPECIES: hypothetical protein [unclassified Bradyrhizobium]|uniref:hypothetical protein n=1 Tax=unclassified Bradyrhizobium TaxID=2631580 RepID=UPI002479ED35|nr:MULTISPECIES: hypothetical protein [unclassified Bradyrhizobium]WGR72025.1 hypothetical protein MTX24_03410 [Bradyrhizobium sp. ISRA426]WGR76859.1 hypothetical protein MTX21_28360 [Bradyrhizobium sp. ISRA430]WGR87264.1 hypothetical protein MTX25_03410 [Bradyrhizobium sp. ISRA432]